MSYLNSCRSEGIAGAIHLEMFMTLFINYVTENTSNGRLPGYNNSRNTLRDMMEESDHGN